MPEWARELAKQAPFVVLAVVALLYMSDRNDEQMRLQRESYQTQLTEQRTMYQESVRRQQVYLDDLYATVQMLTIITVAADFTDTAEERKKMQELLLEISEIRRAQRRGESR